MEEFLATANHYLRQRLMETALNFFFYVTIAIIVIFYCIIYIN